MQHFEHQLLLTPIEVKKTITGMRMKMETKKWRKKNWTRKHPPWISCLCSECLCTSSWSLWCHTACRCRRGAAGRASWWTVSPSRYASPPPSSACRRTPASRRGSWARRCRTPPPTVREVGAWQLDLRASNVKYCTYCLIFLVLLSSGATLHNHLSQKLYRSPENPKI